MPADVLVPAPRVRPAWRPVGGTGVWSPSRAPVLPRDDAVEIVVRRLRQPAPGSSDAIRPDGSAWAVLSAAEQQRAGAMIRPDDAARFVLARATLRESVGRRIGVAPGTVELRLVAGRPVVEDCPELAVSIAHSADTVVVATGFGARIGVDIEAVDPSLGAVEMIAIARDLLGADDLPDVTTTSREQASAWFLRRWTLTEAVLKALGTGFRADPRLVRLAFAPSRAGMRPPRRRETVLVSAPGTDGDAARNWSVRSFRIGPAIVGALAVDRSHVLVHGPEIEPG